MTIPPPRQWPAGAGDFHPAGAGGPILHQGFLSLAGIPLCWLHLRR